MHVEETIREQARWQSGPRSRLGIVDPDPLTRWSLTSYLAGEYDIITADSVDEALQVFSRQSVAAIIISDDFPGRGTDRIVSLVRSTDPNVLVIRTITTTGRGDFSGQHTVNLEKPFQLDDLAGLLHKARVIDSEND